MRRPTRPLTTYSIVARQPKTGELGVAVQSHWFSVGSVVSWAEAGVGAVATQSFAEPAYGPRALDLMKSGLTARKALAALITVDALRDERQVAVLDCRGGVHAHTGGHCSKVTGHHVGKGYSVQASMVRSTRVVPAMAKAFEARSGPLEERLLAALQAAGRTGNGVRGRQSAAILVVCGRSSGVPTKDRLVDLRVDDHLEPVSELGRLLVLHRAHGHMHRGDEAMARGNAEEALYEYGEAARLAPDNLEMAYWHAVALARNGRVKEALPMFRQVFAQEKAWRELTRRLHEPGIIPNTTDGRALIAQILGRPARVASRAAKS